MAYEGMLAETVSINVDKNQPISAYVARPLGPGPFPGMVLLHHAPGWDEWARSRGIGGSGRCTANRQEASAPRQEHGLC